jgi:transcriptional regulator with XRE-family HTH domain
MTKDLDSRLTKIGEKIKELRINAGFSSYETFAVEHNLERKQYWRVESGKNLTFKTLFNVLDIHGISPEDFFRGIE